MRSIHLLMRRLFGLGVSQYGLRCWLDLLSTASNKLFLNTQIPACLWFLSRAKESDQDHPRRDKILFIDARNIGGLISRKTREFSPEDVSEIASIYHRWKADENYEDVPGFCKSANITDVAALGYILTPGRYIGLPDDEDDFDFAERIQSLTAELKVQMAESLVLDERIKANLTKVEVDANE